MPDLLHIVPLDTAIGPAAAETGQPRTEKHRPQPSMDVRPVMAARSSQRTHAVIASAPEALDVLLLDAECRQTLATLRTYARDGLRVGTVARKPDAWWAPSMRSRWSAISAEVPDYSNDPDAFVDGVLEVLDRYPARMLLPAHDGSIQALRSRRAEIEQRVALPLASEAALDIAVRKAKTLALAAELGIPTPRSVHVHDLDEVPAALATVGLPAVIKPEQSWVERDGVGMRLSSEAVQSTDQAKRSLESVFAAGGHALMQQWLPGRREAVSLFYVQDRFWARMAQVSHREWPVLGGVSVMCETIPLLADITEFSERLVRAVALEGNSMVEFRRDQAGIPVLMEVNPRMGGSLALALSAGVNLPRLTYDWMLGNRLTPFAGYRVGKRLRWLVGDIWNLKCVYETQGHPDSPRRLNATASFVSDFFRPANTLDGIDVHDLRPAISEMNKIVFRHAVGRVQRILPSIGAHRRGE